ncbi:SUMF1/EgtB/PvdO family nonheme iron enzyme [Vibrio sp. TH_r3]|uniref:SUMF1/EgtB/PvdO family nonheme iron enzyme n=1 Tax=Vibrio sp. TH_r3 TaxID=3082084 RepID=UPI002955DC30|nr:SUMF1/EgtB/PvdO family nonheme iron enzyme [Vibrio sp. TH_r3]MDV7104851.1 SUMF1/EgtB/PvdO family nonheme iron enzyme [Vibrio sp. TH_r3]
MRQGLPVLLLALSPCFVSATTFALETTSSANIQQASDALELKQAEMDASAEQIAKQKSLIQTAQTKQSSLEKLSVVLDNKLKQSKSALDKDYARIADEPEFDIKPSQKMYQNSWAEVKKNQKERLESQQKIQELYADLSLFEADQKRLAVELNQLSEQKIRARIEKLRTELSQEKQLTVSFTNVCKNDMTIAQCADRTQDLALQKAVTQYQDNLIANVSEQNLVKQNIESASLNIHVINKKASKSSFVEGNRYQAILDVTMQARPATNTPCKLLDVASAYCFDAGQQQMSQQEEIQWVTVTVRSNQYEDKVTIDGVSYGSTPLDLMLPVGSHQVTIEKQGYRPFKRELNIREDHTLRANLQQERNIAHSGQKFADKLNNQSQAPEMTVIAPGQYQINQNSSITNGIIESSQETTKIRQVTIKKAFAMSVTPITVSQFKAFIDATHYKTDAELKKICIAIEESQVTPITNGYWRNPGFKQEVNSPVVCVSMTDAIAYTNWLSKQTGHTYRLPSEAEWQIAAQAGNKNAYWWGNTFGSGKANTGWSGTQWSNTSTSPVKSFAPNRFGLYDVVGNVWEWTKQPQGSQSNQEINANQAIAKGGAWSFSPNQATAQSRLYLTPNTSANYLGFRILRQL